MGAGQRIFIAMFILVALIAGAFLFSMVLKDTQNVTSTNASNVREDKIIIKDFKFIPTSLSVSAGTTVVWENQDNAAHTIVSDSAPSWTSPQLFTGNSFELKFDTPGTYDYHCGVHPSMKGQIIVN